MEHNSEMSSRTAEKCSSCGSELGVFTAVVACVSKSFWEASFQWLLEDIRIWQIWLCNRCRRSLYVSFLSERTLAARQSLKGTARAFALTAGAAIVSWLLVPPLRPWFHEHPFGRSISAILFAFFSLWAIIALVAAPFHAARLLIASRRLREVEGTGVVPEEGYKQAAEAAAKKILDELEKSNESFRPGFELPRFKKSEEYPAELRKSVRSRIERVIRASADSREKLEAKLLQEEKRLLAEREKAARSEA